MEYDPIIAGPPYGGGGNAVSNPGVSNPPAASNGPGGPGTGCSQQCMQPMYPPNPIDPTVRRISDQFFVNIRSETYRCVRVKEQDILTVPWGPKFDVIFDPKGAPGIVGGLVRITARTSGTEVELARAIITDPNNPITLSGALACDEYVVKASLGTDPGPNVRMVESYFVSRVYATG